MIDGPIYLTIAQVLPALLIAIILELRALRLNAQRDLDAAVERLDRYEKVDSKFDVTPDSLEMAMANARTQIGDAKGRSMRGLALFRGVAVAFVIGELAAIFAAATDDRGWILATIVGASLATTIALAVILPLINEPKLIQKMRESEMG